MRLTLSSPTTAAAPIERVVVRLVEVRGERVLSITEREGKRDTVHNLPLDEAVAWLQERLGSHFAGAMLATTAADWQLRLQDGAGKLIRHKPGTPVAPPRTHDESKPTELGTPAQPWLLALGIVDAHGKPRPKFADKHTQIDRFTEILHHLANDAGFGAPGRGEPVRVVDVGCGKGLLTFALWHLFANVLRVPVAVTGVELRGELVDGANAQAAPLCGEALRFVRGDIDAVPLPGVDVLVALHACNTATDHAIRRGIEAGARCIVVAPCCHQEVRPQLGKPEPLADVLAHGLFAERLSEWVTDGLRALVLEHHGYRTKAIEFVSTEHTGKNLLLAGVRGPQPSDAQRAASRAKIAAFRAFFGVGKHALDPLLTD